MSAMRQQPRTRGWISLSVSPQGWCDEGAGGMLPVSMLRGKIPCWCELLKLAHDERGRSPCPSQAVCMKYRIHPFRMRLLPIHFLRCHRYFVVYNSNLFEIPPYHCPFISVCLCHITWKSIPRHERNHKKISPNRHQEVLFKCSFSKHLIGWRLSPRTLNKSYLGNSAVTSHYLSAKIMIFNGEGHAIFEVDIKRQD